MVAEAVAWGLSLGGAPAETGASTADRENVGDAMMMTVSDL
jgi:hypothetical protein